MENFKSVNLLFNLSYNANCTILVRSCEEILEIIRDA